ncbi:hypothetical protein N7534_003555 [Penicillium rubens]|nr:hypothetical protein N7534_003555 [Penicillium rubens]
MQSATTGMMHTTGTHVKQRVVGNNGKSAKRATTESPGNAICSKCEAHPAGGPDGFEEWIDLTI